MELPLEIEFEPPTRDDVLRGLRALRSWRGLLGISLTAGAIAGGVWLYRHFTVNSPVSQGSISVATTPDQAYLSIDGQPRGQTPVSVPLPAGRHAVTLALSGYAPVHLPVDVDSGRQTDVLRELWPMDSRVLPVRPPLPGSRVASTVFQDDGSLALDVELSTDEHQLWLVDSQGSYRQLGPSAHGSIALTSDGGEFAFVDAQSSGALSYATRNAVWLSGPGGDDRHLAFALPGDQNLSQIAALSWEPGSRELLAVATDQGSTGAGRSRLMVIADGGSPRQVIAIPAMVIPGSYTWSPNGHQVAFLAKSGSATSLCLLNLADGRFRYLADVGGTTDQLPLAEVTWAPDGSRVFFTAEEAGQNVVALWPFAGSPAAKLYSTPAGGGPASQFSATALRSPVAVNDGTLLGFVRGKGGNVFLEAMQPGLTAEPITSTGLQRERFAARWDVSHHQAMLLAIGSSTDGSDRTETWLVRFTPGGQP